MSTSQFQLASPPQSERARELWLQNAAGFILFEDVRNYAVRQMSESLSQEARAAAVKAIDDALYGLMMVLDGVTGALANAEYLVRLRASVSLSGRTTSAQAELAQVDLADGDGMCMGFHAWLNDDFGNDAIVE